MIESAVRAQARPLTLAGLLKARAAESPDREAYLFLADGETEAARLTWEELDERARAVAAALRQKALVGDRALLLYPPGLDFIAAFFGCLYAGIVAVPVYPPRLNNRSQSRLRSIARDARPLVILTTAELAGRARVLTHRMPELAAVRWIATEGLVATDENFPEPDPQSVAFLQYTSGSTAAPKGVMVTHANLLHNEEMIGEAFGVDEESVVVGWLPLYHDMGLIGNVLQPLWAGARCVLMSPVAFLQRPRRWLEAIHRYRGTTSGGPNFAYELSVRKVPPEERQGLDLSSWRIAFNGAEPVRTHTLEAFAEAFAPCGFRPEALYSCYGLAEATLFVSGGKRGRLPRTDGARVGCGHAWGGQRLAIVELESQKEVVPGKEGEIWIAGESVAAGYWGNAAATARDFRAHLATGEGPFLRTGDLGILRAGELFVTGRIKDLIILRGRNHYPQDIELTAEQSHSDLHPEGGAAFAVEVDGEERLVVVQEVERRRKESFEGLIAAIRQAVAEEHEVQPYEVVLVRAGTVPKTSSGKIQRHAVRAQYLAGELNVLSRSTPAAAESLTGAGGDVLREVVAEVLGLPVEMVHPDQPLTSLGLDSLSAAELIGRLESRLRIRAPLGDLLEGTSVRTLAELVSAAEPSPLPVHDPSPDQPLSVGQRALWFLERFAPEEGAYNVAVAARVRGLDVEALHRALTLLVERHPALRTVFPVMGEEPIQRVLPEARIDFEKGADDPWRPFDLVRGPLLRVRILDDLLLVVVHHLVCDFWSLAVLARELGALYSGADPPPSSPLGFADFARWQAEQLASPRGERLAAFWSEALEGVPDLALTPDRPRPPIQTFRGVTRAAELPVDRSERLRQLAGGEGATLFAVLLAVFQALLGRYASQEDFAVGAPTSGRGEPEWADVVGYFVNPVALRADLTGEPSFRELLVRMRSTVLAALEHADYPFVLIAETLRPVRDPARPPLFQTMLALQQRRAGDDPCLPAFALGEDDVRISLGDLELESVALRERRAQFEISLNAAELPSGALALSLEVNADLFDAATAERMLGHFRTLLAAAVAAPDRRLSDSSLLTEAEAEQLRQAPALAPVANACPHDLFAEQARRRPEAEAVIVGEERLTYAELMRRASELAARLRQMGIGPEVPVGLLVKRSADLVVGAIGILQAGGVYLPLDPDMAPARLQYILEDAGAAVVVRQGLDLERVAETVRYGTVLPANAAYLIYTSGSTGRPKGVVVTHAAAVEHCLTWARAYEMTERDRVLQFPSASFDASVEQIFSTLLSGATLVLRGPELWSPRELEERIEEQRLTIVDLPTAYFSRWVQDVEAVPDSLRLIGIGGEELRKETALRWSGSALAQVPLFNSYGPTEAVISATLGEVEADAVSIGRVLPGRVARVLDLHGQPQPLGVPGELYLGGTLARGYLGRPDLTAERFVPDAWGPPGSRLYRTGDRVRLRTDGNFEFLGRLDDQIKLRGFRIEPGEIEAVLTEQAGIREAAVLAAGQGEHLRLVAFVAPALPAVSLRDVLSDYMIPSAWLALPELPLNTSGKVDRAALARLVDQARSLGGEGSDVPRTPDEELLAGIWADLLGRERIGIHDDFFSLGGHSLLATRVVARVSRVFGVDLPVSAVFQTPTVAGLVQRIAAASRAEKAPPMPPMLPGVPSEAKPLSFAQRRLWFLEQLEPGTAVYNVPGEVRLRGPLDIAALADAFAGVLRRHEVLRTIYESEEGEPRQRVAREEPLRLVDLTELPASANQLARDEARRPFDLTRGPVCRALLLRLAPEEHRLLVTFHHIASDGWSLGLFLDELSALYAGQSLPELPVQYGDFAAWQRERGPMLESQLAYWRGRLSGLPVLELPADRPRPAVRDSRGAVRSLSLPEETVIAIERLARREGVTVFMVLLGTFQALLARYTGESVIPVGSPVANRRRLEVERLIGLFVNTLVLDARTGDDPALRDLLARVREACLGAYAHQDVPFERLVEELQPTRDLSQNPLFQVMLVLEEPLPARTVGGLTLEPVRSETGTAKFDLLLAASPCADGGWDLLAEYATALFDAVTIDRLLEHFRTLLESIADPVARLSELPLFTQSERQQVRIEWNDTHAESAPGCLHDLVWLQAERTPDAVAVVGESERLTYRKLMERSAQFAVHLRSLGVSPEVKVGLCLERTPDLIAAILGILESGGAYVPLDPAYPEERLKLMLTDSGAEVLVTQASLADRLAFFNGQILLSEVPPLPVRGMRRRERGLGGEGLAYVIYTSGSTGRPKGVGIEHRSAVTLVQWALEVFPREDLQGVLAATSVCFDLSIFEIFVPLAVGGSVVLAPNVIGLPQLSSVEDVTLVNAVPSPMAELVDGRLPFGLRTVNLAGEALKADLVERIYAHPQVERVVNLYGPSEDTTYSTWTVVPRGSSQVTIGRPIANTGVRVLGQYGEPLPLGVPGELFLSGAGLARGYLGRPDLTADRFLPDPFGPAGARMYRTGDRVRLLSDGQLDFLGRLDYQVKLHGIRIELGEIEAALEIHPAVRQTVAALRSDGPEGARLVGYVVPVEEHEDLTATLVKHLRAALPAAMVPTAWVVLPELPLSPNGKVDRKVLPAPSRPESAASIAPRNAVEEKLADIWRELLGLERVGVHDSFFELGGHSLLAVRAAFRIGAAFGVDLPVAAIFQAPTVASLAMRLAGLRTVAEEAPLSRETEGPFPLSFPQQRLWFLECLQPGHSGYNLGACVLLQGNLSLAALAGSLGEIVRRHEALRTVYVEQDGEPWQSVLPADAQPAQGHLDLSSLPQQRRDGVMRNATQSLVERPFDLERGPVARFLAVTMQEGSHALLAAFHHIASDGWSLEVFFRDLAGLYGAAIAGRPSPLPALPWRYADYTLWQRRSLSGEGLAEPLAYWRGRLAGAPVLELPTDRPRPAVWDYRGGSRPFEIAPEMAAALEALARAEGGTLFMALLACFLTLLARISGEDDLSVGVPVAGRNRAETEGMIGLFVNTLVLRIGAADAPSFRELVRRVREATLGAQAHQDVPFERLVEELQPERVLGASPLFQVLFAFLSAVDAPVEIPGLRLSLVDSDVTTARFDLTCSIHQRGERVHGWLEYPTSLFDAATANRLRDHFLNLLRSAVADPQLGIDDLAVLSKAEEHQLLREWNESAIDVEFPTSVLPFLQARIMERPEAVALTSSSFGSITYGELGRRADRLAHKLRRLGIGAEAQVGILLDRSPAVAAAILGVWKAGAACVPLDPGLPEERLAWMAADSGIAALVSESPQTGWNVPVLGLEDRHDGDGPVEGEPGRLAYLIYTSGTTGRPKAVMVEHRSLAQTLVASLTRFGFGQEDRMPHLASFSFDISLFELLIPLLSGGQVEVLSRSEVLELPRLAEALRSATRFHAVPSLMRRLVDFLGTGEALSLRTVFVGGERVPADLLWDLQRTFPSAEIVVLYGPTEAAIVCAAWAARDGEERNLLGRPLPGVELRLLDRWGTPVPIGVPGDLHIGGEGVARGYHRRADLTADRFGPAEGDRLYRTGDLARVLPDGRIEFLGRTDQQVKVRGFRVEPGEIEAALREQSGVQDAVVTAPRIEGEPRLAAYVVLAGPSELEDRDRLVGRLRSGLSVHLPDHMVPSLWTVLSALPLAPNGKVDLRALPEPEEPRAGSATGFRTPEEELLAGLWAEVLNVEHAGPGDRFFDLGGHSLLATQLASRVRLTFGVEVPLAELLQAPTLAEQARTIEAVLRRGSAAGAEKPPLVPQARHEPSPLSFAQERLWFLDRLEPGPLYNMPLAARLSGPLSLPAFAAALDEIVRRHEALRTRFLEERGRPVQSALPWQPRGLARLPEIDLSGLPEGIRDAAALELAEDEARRPIDLSSGRLLRASLLRLRRDQHLVLLTLHHIAADGWSMGVLLRELAEIYAAAAEGRPSSLPDLAVQYADFALWQRSWLSGEPLERELDHWRERLAGAPEALDLPTDRPRRPNETARGAQLPFELSTESWTDLVRLSRRRGWTPFMALLAAFQGLLARWSGQRDLVVGSPIANRTRIELEELIGFFANTLALRLALEGDPPFIELANRARTVCLDAYAHQDLPFEKLVEEIAPQREAGRTPLFQVMLALQNAPLEPVIPGLGVELLEVGTGTAKFDLVLVLLEPPGGVASDLIGGLEYSRDLFDEATAVRLLGHFRTLLEGAVSAPATRLSDLSLLTAAEQAELTAWTRPVTPRPPELLVHEGVAAQAERTPDALAVVDGQEGLTYAELLAHARRLAVRLRELGVGPDVPVGLFLERSLDMMVAVLGVLEAGGAYLPLDPSWPEERLRVMLENAEAPVLVTHGPLAGATPAGAKIVVRVDEVGKGAAPAGLEMFSSCQPGAYAPGYMPSPPSGAQDMGDLGLKTAPEERQHVARGVSPGYEAQNPPEPRRGDRKVTPDHLCYLIYTSGSTGRPKGVAMTHAAITAMLLWQRRTSNAGAGRTLQYTSLSFDVSFQEIFSTWWAGGTLVLVSEEVRRDPVALVRHLAEQRVERLFLPYVALQQIAMAAAGEGSPFPASLREVLSAGEQLYVTPHVAELFSRLPGAELHNHYGPSETHAVTWLALRGDAARWPERPPIGAPVDHARVFLLDADLQPVPVGVTGEVWVGGAGLARGYLRRPRLTAEGFLPDPFHWVEGWRPGDRIYRTGDLARYRRDEPDGVLEFLGRHDAQVKIRGHRVELSEVETALARHPAVQQAAVSVRGATSGVRRLVAYVVLREGSPVPAWTELRAFLAETLPDPMVPTAWARIDALPLTPSGKLDRRALSRIEPEDGLSEGELFVEPRTPAEELLAMIWSEVLGARRVGAYDDFFGLGGHSLLATQLTSRIREAFGVDLPLRRVFEAPALADMAAAVLAAEGAPVLPPIARDANGGDLPLSFAQERLWFLDRLQPGGPAYNVPLAINVEGHLDVARMAAVLSEIVRRHEILRTVFAEQGGVPSQVVRPFAQVPLHTIDLHGLPEERRILEAQRLAVEEAVRSFDLEVGPLLRAALLELAEERSLLLLSLHHIVTDGWSMGILVREVSALYRGERLPELPVQYGDFARWQRRWLSGDVLERQIAWWRERLRGAPAALELAADHPRPPLQSLRGAEHRFELGPELARRIKEVARDLGVTPFMVLAGGAFALLSRLTGQLDLTLGSPIANRNRLETESLIGFFVNTLVLRADLSRAATFRDLLRQVREASLGAYAHQDVPFEKLVDELHPERDLSRSPLFQVALALQNAPLPAPDLGGMRLVPEEIPTGVAKFDLSFVFAEDEAGFAGVLQYATDLYEAPTVLRLSRYLATLLETLTSRPRGQWAEASLLAAEERQQIVREWNDTASPFSRELTIHGLFERMADLQPNGLAAMEDGGSWTYAALEARANQLAHLLRDLGIGQDTAVGVWMERSLDMIAAVLAVLKAGGCYVPIDPSWPAERAEAILSGVKATVVLTRAATLAWVQEIQWSLPLAGVVCLDVVSPEVPAEELDPESVRALWDFVAERATDRATAGGFVSSYTGQPFTETEVDEYRDRVLSLAAPWLRPDARVLEIGCGAGLLLWEMSARVASAVGLDPSPATQERNRAYAAEHGIGNVELRTGFAHEIDELSRGGFDLIVMASTVQFFPGQIYLERVIEKALRLLAPGGALLVADVPDARRRAEFQRSLGKTSQGKEMWLDEDLFRDLGEASILHRETGFNNELRFRFDVLLRPGPKARRKRLWTGWHVERQSPERLEPVLADGFAYVIHTSGSTGAPKGIAVRHAPAVNLIEWVNAAFGVGPGDRLLFITSLGFDLSVYDVFGTLAGGGTIRIAPERALRDPEQLARMLTAEPITIWDSAPAALQQLAPLFPDDGAERPLRLVLLSGDWIPVGLPDQVRTAFPSAQVISLGGATEATVWSNWYPIAGVHPEWTSIPYGRPITNARYHVLDGELSPCPVGAPGDLYIGGEVLCTGYPYQPELTAAQFVPDPFEGTGERLYRTGDRARWLSDGNLEFLGRVDQQVKIRGYRIELGEIEVALSRHPSIREAVVLAREDVPGDKRLVAYAVPAGSALPAAAELRAFLQESLPEYMIPWSFVELKSLPVTGNGKLDRAALPAPRAVRAETDSVAPRNELERSIAAVWREVLQLDRVGVRESFFEVGGSSLLLARLQSRLRHVLGREIPFVDLFRHPTIESLASSLGQEEPQPELKAGQARARTDTRRESLRQLQRRRMQRRGGGA